MSDSQQSSAPSLPSAIVLTDWAADDENLGSSPHAILYDFLLLSLLYDHILIQDEALVLSDRFATWFSEPGNLTLLKKCLELGTITVLAHRTDAYPTEELKTLREVAPITARARYIQKFGTRGELPFVPSPRQEALYPELDVWLRTHREAQRPVGMARPFDIMATFGGILKDILSSKKYVRWLQSAFAGITDEMAADFIGFIENPTSLVSRLHTPDKQVKILWDAGRPVFNRSLGFQAATLYSEAQKNAMQRLIQTTFAAPFCWREDAGGRYSNSFRELLWLPPGLQLDLTGKESPEEVVSVEASVDIALPIPDLNSNFVDAVCKVRESAAGQALRQSVRQLGDDIDFNSQVQSWYAVADELSHLATLQKPFNIRATALRCGPDLVVGAVAGTLFDFVRTGGVSIPAVIAGAFLDRALGLLCNHGLMLLQSDLQEQKLRRALEKSVEFRCSSLAMPPVIVGAD
jgi:hypothetical protein